MDHPHAITAQSLSFGHGFRKAAWCVENLPSGDNEALIFGKFAK
jgi:hypothetical protein